jgi:putative membrane-bound dehydrogenase-like protein
MSMNGRTVLFSTAVFGLVALGLSPTASQGQDVVPHGQNRAPGKPLSPVEAIRAMTVPDGFQVELVASEPDIVNPVAMTFDERGRIWVTESLEYPRRSPGPGRDRVKILEDTDADGKADRFTVFAEGLNIPSGIAVGHGGVWVANSPDILFFQDTDGDGKADRREVVVTGFGRSDTHELPNSLTWGPDGWLYGWNGVFNPSHVEYRGKTYDFTCAVFRIHPKTREFELFCEGTSNPWGITWDEEGSAFASACVIDHLWHLTETGYYHRQGGPYPRFTWKIGSIVGHNHQKAAYCGIHFYDSDAYPASYRGKLFMGNIHGNCVNVDSLARNGSTYVGSSEPDFLQANDAWFMPVSQKTGPDGCLYVLDWYDRYHCYQDANRDSAGIDRLKGRLYRVRYKDTPRRAKFDLGIRTDAELTDLLDSPNGFDRDTARRLLIERNTLGSYTRLRDLALNSKAQRRTRMNALWVLVGRSALETDDFLNLLADPDPGFRAWGVRAAGNARRVAPAVREKIGALARDAHPDVQLQVAIAARKLEGIDPVGLLFDVASACGKDGLIPHIVWQNLYPLLDGQAGRFSVLITQSEGLSPALTAILPRAFDVAVAQGKTDSRVIAALLGYLIPRCDGTSVRQAIGTLAGWFKGRDRDAPSANALRRELLDVVYYEAWRKPHGSLATEFRVLAAYWSEPRGLAEAQSRLLDPSQNDDLRLRALEALIYAVPGEVLSSARKVLEGKRVGGSSRFRGEVLSLLGNLDEPAVSGLILASFSALEADLKPRAIELLTQRVGWSLALLKAIGEGKVPASSLNANQVRRMLATRDPELVKQVGARWGTLREGRDAGRERVISEMRVLLGRTEGDPIAGVAVFKKLCAQCHKLYGEGQDVGPEITLNGRNSYEQLLSNVFDPSLVIGAAYQGTTVATSDGRILTGLLAENSPQRVVLKMQGGKVETVPRSDVEELKVSPMSLMPEDLEKQLQPQEIADLFAFITLDRPPGDPAARPIPGAGGLKRRMNAR